jgi:hypothetical protein
MLQVEQSRPRRSGPRFAASFRFWPLVIRPRVPETRSSESPSAQSNAYDHSQDYECQQQDRKRIKRPEAMSEKNIGDARYKHQGQ